MYSQRRVFLSGAESRLCHSLSCLCHSLCYCVWPEVELSSRIGWPTYLKFSVGANLYCMWFIGNWKPKYDKWTANCAEILRLWIIQQEKLTFNLSSPCSISLTHSSSVAIILRCWDKHYFCSFCAFPLVAIVHPGLHLHWDVQYAAPLWVLRVSSLG